MKVVREREVMAQCSEPLCRITIWVDADDKEHKCVSCQMRDKLLNK